jgi:hypothetical protein
MITKQIIGKELYVYLNGKLIYKRWLDKQYGMIFCKLGNFTAKDIKKNSVIE